jgi:hypothetical protein
MRMNGLTRLVCAAVAAAGLAPAAAAQQPVPLPAPTPYPYPAVPTTPVTQAAAMPSNVRVYVLDGVDPTGSAGMEKLAARLRMSGYPNTKYGGWYEARWFEWQFRREHAKDPSLQSVWIGYSAGTYTARGAANRLTRDGLPVAMVGYVGGDYLTDTPESRPGNVPVVNVRGDGYLLTGKNWFWNGTELTGANNVDLRGTRHFDLPRHPQTGAALINGLNAATGAGAPAVTPYGSFVGR